MFRFLFVLSVILAGVVAQTPDSPVLPPTDPLPPSPPTPQPSVPINPPTDPITPPSAPISPPSAPISPPSTPTPPPSVPNPPVGTPQGFAPSDVPTEPSADAQPPSCLPNGEIELRFKYMDWAAVIVLWCAGLIFTFFGYRIFKPIIFMSGFIICFALVYLACAGNTDWLCTNLWWLPLVLGFVGAFIGGFLFVCIIPLGIFFVGFAFGVALGSIALSTPLGTTVMTAGWQHLLVTLGGGLFFGILALIAQKTLIIVSTSVFGAYMIACGIDMKFMNPPILSQIIPHMLSGKGLIIDWPSISNAALPYLLLGGLIIFALAGIIVQFFWTGKDFDHRKGRVVRYEDPYADQEPLLTRNSSINV